MTEEEINKLIREIASKKTLFGLSAQPRKPKDLAFSDSLASDSNVYDEWVNEEWLIQLSDFNENPLDKFSKGLSELLSIGNRKQEYNLAIAKVIRGSFETGQFSVGQDTKPLKEFFLKNPDIANFMARRIQSLNAASDSLEEYIKRPKNVMGSMSDLEKNIQSARQAVINKLQEHAKLFKLKSEIFANNTLKILPKSLVPFRVQKLHDSKNNPGFDNEIKKALDELEILERRLKELAAQYLQQKREILQEQTGRDLGKKTRQQYQDEAQKSRDDTPKLVANIVGKKASKPIPEESRVIQQEKENDLRLRSKFVRQLLTPEELRDIACNKLAMLKEKVSAAINKIVKIHGIKNGFLESNNGTFSITSTNLAKLVVVHPNASKEIKPLIDFGQVLDRSLNELNKEPESIVESLDQVGAAADVLRKLTESLPATSWVKRLCDAICRFFDKSFKISPAESYAKAEEIITELNNPILDGDKKESLQPLLLTGFEQAKDSRLNKVVDGGKVKPKNPPKF